MMFYGLPDVLTEMHLKSSHFRDKMAYKIKQMKRMFDLHCRLLMF